MSQSSNNLRRKAKLFLAASVVLISCLFFYSLYTSSSDKITGAFIGTGEQELEKAFSVSAGLEPADLEIKGEDFDIELKLSQQTGSIEVEGMRFGNFKDDAIIIKGYKGTIKIGETNMITLDGKAAKVLVNDMEADKEGRALEVSAESLRFDELKIAKLSLKSLAFSSSGKIDVFRRGSFEVNGEDAKLTPFRGSISIDKYKFSFQGEAESLVIESVPKVVIN